nr:MAG TPA: hypothetical protein [Caudoviricetes sp.]
MVNKVICENEKEIIGQMNAGKRIIIAYGDIEVSEKTARKIKKKKILVIGRKREEKDERDS